MMPDYAGANVRALVPALVGPGPLPDWLDACRPHAPTVLLVVDGLGWEQLQVHAESAPNLMRAARRSITTVAPSTTAAALTSITTGLPPGEHGIVGYRMALGGEVINSLSWRGPSGDVRRSHEPARVQPFEPFLGVRPPVVSRYAFRGSGFSDAHLRGGPFVGWAFASSMALLVREQLDRGATFVYTYYDGVDTVAHQYGFGPYYDAELQAVDALVGQLEAALPSGTDLVVTADHGQVHVGDALVTLDVRVAGLVAYGSGEGRFRWLHARPGAAADLLAASSEAHSDVAWVISREQAIDEGLYGAVVAPPILARLGDVALIAREPVSIVDPAEANHPLVCRHGSLTSAEMLVPLCVTNI